MDVDYNSVSLPNGSLNLSDYRIVRELGKGGFGTTYLAEDTRGHQYALKLIDYQAALDQGLSADEIVGEADSLRTLSEGQCNPYLICYYGSWDFMHQGKRYIAIVSDFVDGMSLRDFLNQPQYGGGYISTAVLWPLITQMLYGIQYIHSKGYAHRDIKPENIMLTRDLNVKFIDFGLACTRTCQSGSCYDTCRGLAGTLAYDAPEMLNRTYQENITGAQKRDIWALVVVFYEMVGGNYSYPFTVFSSFNQWLPTDDIIRNIISEPLKYPAYQQDDGRTNEFLFRNIVRDVNARPDINQLIAAWVSNVIGRPQVPAPAVPEVVYGDQLMRQQLQPVDYHMIM